MHTTITEIDALASTVDGVEIPASAHVPGDMWQLNVIEALNGFCPVQSVCRRARVDHIAALISETLAAA